MKVKDYREKNRQIHIPIDEYDMEIFQEVVDGKLSHIDWTLETDDGEPINLKFIKYYKEEE
jgi:hypothetical protein